MLRLSEKYKNEVAGMNDPIEVIERVRRLIEWSSREEDHRLRRAIKVSIDVLLEHLEQLIRGEGE